MCDELFCGTPRSDAEQCTDDRAAELARHRGNYAAGKASHLRGRRGAFTISVEVALPVVEKF
jgi:hypothetical protein